MKGPVALAGEDPSRCALCGEPNDCALAGAASGDRGTSGEACWCVREVFPRTLIDRVAEHERGRRCICRRCLGAETASTSGSVETDPGSARSRRETPGDAD